MFWKIFGGIVAFFMAVVLAVGLLATVSVAVFGAAVSSIVEDLDISTVQVTDAEGDTESYDFSNLLSESGRIEVSGENGERVTVDLEVPQITVRESGEEGARVIVGGGSRFERRFDVPQIRIDGRNIDRFDSFDGGFFARAVTGLFRGLFKLVIWTMILVGVWLVLRSRRPADNGPKEKTPDATA